MLAGVSMSFKITNVISYFYFIGAALSQIVVCCNEMESQDDVDQLLKHELIHVFDDCRAGNLDWTKCAHHACSEVPI